jgi:hypothetical protein
MPPIRGFGKALLFGCWKLKGFGKLLGGKAAEATLLLLLLLLADEVD